MHNIIRHHCIKMCYMLIKKALYIRATEATFLIIQAQARQFEFTENQDIDDMARVSRTTIGVTSGEFGSLRPDKYRLEEISFNLRPLNEVGKIKQKIQESLRDVGLNGNDFSGFYLGSMKVFSNFNERRPMHKILEQSYSGCLLAKRLLGVIEKTSKKSGVIELVKKLAQHIQQVLSVIGNALRIQGWSVPDDRFLRQEFEDLRNKLVPYVQEYVKGNPNFELSTRALISQHERLVINYQLIIELEEAIDRLCDVIGTLKARRVGYSERRSSESVLHAEVLEM